MSGRRSIGRRAYEITPRSASASRSIAIATGRRVEKRGRDMVGLPDGAAHRRLEVDQRAHEAVARLDHLPPSGRLARDRLLELLEGARAEPVLLARELERLGRDRERALRDAEPVPGVPEGQQARP